MFILAAGDFQGKRALLDGAIAEANNGPYELFLGLGDYYRHSDYEYLNEHIQCTKLFTTGNWDLSFNVPENEEFPNLYNYIKADFTDKEGEQYKVVLMGNRFPPDFLEDIQEWLGDFPPQKLIIATHYPPLRTRDLSEWFGGVRAGFEEFRKAILRLKPAVWCCGHIHEAAGVANLMRSTVVNAAVEDTGKAYAIEITKEGVQSIDEVDITTQPQSQ